MGKVLGKLFSFEQSLATTMRQTAGREEDEKRRAELLGIASQYEFLADSLLRKSNGFDFR
jgi:hypothetical protein